MRTKNPSPTPNRNSCMIPPKVLLDRVIKRQRSPLHHQRSGLAESGQNRNTERKSSYDRLGPTGDYIHGVLEVSGEVTFNSNSNSKANSAVTNQTYSFCSTLFPRHQDLAEPSPFHIIIIISITTTFFFPVCNISVPTKTYKTQNNARKFIHCQEIKLSIQPDTKTASMLKPKSRDFEVNYC